MLFLIPEEALRERLLPYVAKLDGMPILEDTVYQIATMVMEHCVHYNRWNDDFIMDKSSLMTWEVLGEVAFEVFNEDDINGDYNKVDANMSVCTDAVNAIAKQMVTYFNQANDTIVANFTSKDPIIMSEVYNDGMVGVSINHQEPDR